MSERPRGELFADPAADVVWAGVLALDEGTKHELLALLRQQLEVPEERESPHQARVARAIAALREAAEILEESPSVEEYRRLRAENPERGWPADGSVRRWCGGTWNDVLERAHLDRIAEPLAAVRPLGHAITEEEAIAAIRECAAELDRTPTFHGYLSWARRPEVKRRPGSRRPASQPPIDRLFGGWLEALKAAGLVDDRGTGAPRGTGLRTGHGYRYTDEQLYAAMEELAELDGGRLPSTARFNHLRAEVLAEEAAAGEAPRAFPSWGVLSRRFGSWPKARHALEQWQTERAESPSSSASDLDPDPNHPNEPNERTQS